MDRKNQRKKDRLHTVYRPQESKINNLIIESVHFSNINKIIIEIQRTSPMTFHDFAIYNPEPLFIII